LSDKQAERNASTLGTAIAADMLLQEVRHQAYSAPTGNLTTDSWGRPKSIKVHENNMDLDMAVSTDNWGRNASIDSSKKSGIIDCHIQSMNDSWGWGAAVTMHCDGKLDATMTIKTDSWGRSPVIEIDRDGDGKPDAKIKVMSDSLGRPETIAVDRYNDGKFDALIDVRTDSWRRNASFKPREK
jgi:hypothetical protein